MPEVDKHFSTSSAILPSGSRSALFLLAGQADAGGSAAQHIVEDVLQVRRARTHYAPHL